MSDRFVSIKQFAADLGMDRSHARRYVLNLGITPEKRRLADSGGQLTLTISTTEADFVRRTRQEQGFLDSERSVASEVGFFYLIQLVPDLDPKRMKLGFADNMDNRLAQHRTSAPTAILLKYWPCKRTWERTVIDAMSSVGGRLISNEVFEFSDIDALLKRGDELFALLPDPAAKVPIAEHSPHGGGR